MDNFSTYQGALEIFRKVNCVSERDNCIIGTIVDISKCKEANDAILGMAALGAVGYIVGSAVGRDKDQQTSSIYDFMYALINFTDTGVGIIPLQGGGMKINPEKLTPVYDAFVFYYYQEMTGITFKNYMGLRKSVKAVTISLANGAQLCFNANMEEKTLPYQQNAMTRLVATYQK